MHTLTNKRIRTILTILAGVIIVILIVLIDKNKWLAPNPQVKSQKMISVVREQAPVGRAITEEERAAAVGAAREDKKIPKSSSKVQPTQVYQTLRTNQ